MTIDAVAQKVGSGERISAGEALVLYRSAPTPLLGRLADAVRARKHPDGIVTYIIDRNVNYTNVCVARCRFCAFYRPVGSSEGYVLAFDELFRKIEETIALGGSSCCCREDTTPICRSSGTRICSAPSRRATRTSSCTRCRPRKSCTSPGCRSCRCLP